MRLIYLILCGIICCVGNLPASSNSTYRVEFKEPQGGAYWIEFSHSSKSSAKSQLIAQSIPTTRTAIIEGTTNSVIMSSRVVVALDSHCDINAFLNDAKIPLSRIVSSNLFIFQANDVDSAIQTATEWSQREDVVECYPVMSRPLKKHVDYAPAPNDPLFSQQWNLENRNTNYLSAGADLNVRSAWAVTKGNGVLVAVGDEGFELAHPELRKRANSKPHFNFYKNALNGDPPYSDSNHGTAVAGLIAAEGNDRLGTVGVAPEAGLASWVIFGSMDAIANDEQLMDMFQYATNQVAVQNHSWGNASTVQLPLYALPNAGIERAIRDGRSGKGIVIIRAGGNEREDLTDANDDGYASDPRVISVAAVRKNGRACTYSSPGACILVSAPSGDFLDSNGDLQPDSIDPDAPEVWTTDRTGTAGYNTEAGDSGNYTYFNGTSASSPQIAGVAALILSVNSALTYRDVQQIMLLSARHFDTTDPDIRTNGAHLVVSHNAGYGVPDAGFAVALAQIWSNRPPYQTIYVTNTTRQNIPDDALRVVCSGPGISASLTSLHCLPALGPHADDGTGALPLVYIGLATNDITVDLRGKAALIQRGQSYFIDKATRAAKAGASVAIIFNDRGTNEIQAIGGTTFSPIPVVSIGKQDGEELRDFLAGNEDTTAQIQLSKAVYKFNVQNSLACEHVGVRIKTTHTRRSDVRVTLVSPMGTRSILQAINNDTSRGPSDWTYWSTHHFYEPSMGNWTLEVSDERNTKIRSSFSGTIAATGSVTFAELIINGVPITDTDADGLEDAWEMKWFSNLSQTAKDDPDHDGYSNAFEQVLGTDPTQSQTSFRLEKTEIASGYWRFVWPGRLGENYSLQFSPNLHANFNDIATVEGKFPLTEYVIKRPTEPNGFYRVVIKDSSK